MMLAVVWAKVSHGMCKNQGHRETSEESEDKT